MKKLFLIIVHYKGKKLTEKCLKSVSALKIKGFDLKVVVVINNPKEDLSFLERKFRQFVFLKTDKNLGFTGANNLGIKHSLQNRADFVVLLNNDTYVAPDFLVQLVKAANKDKEIGIIAPKIYFASGCEYHRTRYKPSERGKVFWYAGGKIDWQNVLCSHRGVDEVDKGQYEKQMPTDFASGCAVLIKREVLNKIGLLDNRYFLYFEDVEFCQRAKQTGFKIIYTPKAKLWHFNAGSSRVGGFLHDYFITRNRLLFGMKYARRRTKFNLAKESIKLLITGRPWQKRAVKDFYFKNLGQGSWHD